MKNIPKSFADILEKPSFAHFSTLMPDGSPQSSPVWIDTEGSQLVINSAEGRVKDQNVRRDPRVAISVADPDNPYRCLMIRGRVSKITNEGADDHINRMAKKYLGADEYPFRQPGEVRVLYYVDPESVATMG
ncbi:MAG TPA: PPOX class F420-dependent oxidoreductase [Polyangiales bacterium]|nr:PPOX class F420-dependent oxidoreductase [Polyangiales bacterium]